MTSTALKAQIDSQITNETTANAITPTDVGTNMKAIVDFIGYNSYKALITQVGTANPVFSTVSKNTTGKTFTIARQSEGVYLIEPNEAFTNAEKVFITVQNQGGYSVLNSISISTTQIFWFTYDFNGTADDLIDYSTITIDIFP
jgi:hypothetical protein